MTFKDYYRVLGFRAFFAHDRAAYHREQDLKAQIVDKDAQIDFHRRALTDALMVTANKRPVYVVPDVKPAEHALTPDEQIAHWMMEKPQ